MNELIYDDDIICFASELCEQCERENALNSEFMKQRERRERDRERDTHS